jgi:hypothetical protein
MGFMASSADKKGETKMRKQKQEKGFLYDFCKKKKTATRRNVDFRNVYRQNVVIQIVGLKMLTSLNFPILT